MPMPMVQLQPNSFGVTGLVIPPNLMNITSQAPVMSLQSTEPSMLTTATTTTFPQMPAPPPLPSLLNTDDITNKTDITEVIMNTDNSQSNDKHNDSASGLLNASNAPLFPPPMPPFQTPLGMPPMPPILGAQPPGARMPWLSGPPPPIHPNRMQGLTQ